MKHRRELKEKAELAGKIVWLLIVVAGVIILTVG